MRSFSITLAGAMLLAVSGPASASVMLDQSFDPGNPPPNGLIVEASQTVAQTFTVGLDGLLSRVEVFVSGNPNTTTNLYLQIRSTLASGAPSSTVLASTFFTPSEVPARQSFGYLGFDLGASEFSVTSGDVLSIVLLADVDGFAGIDPYAWGGIPEGGYSRGRTLVANTAAGFVEATYDHGFRTYVDAASPVPEPASLALMSLGGIGMFGGWYRERRKMLVKAA